MVLYLVAVGRLRDAALRDTCDGYAARLRRYTRFEVREVREAGRRARDPDTVRRLEGEALLEAVPKGARGFALTRDGRAITSEDLAQSLASWQEQARDVALIIGGAHGLHPCVLERAEGTISLSPLTLPHELARVVLTEQVYRAFTILRGEPYHKGTGA
jgi:23S rRNA (pseudouridine1915-N3)-methyltransferase